ncbi:dipeptidase C [Brevipalpus obovatus]|uniref:dipeptidase C n=1 Tax=Brevipalpus obovatus TaxID=246614 RepID=UPI003D9E3DAB
MSVGYFDRGIHTLRVSAKLHQINRQRLIEALLPKFTSPQESQSGGDVNHIVLLQGGQSETRHATDHDPVFRQESYFHWAFGVEEPDFFGAINCSSGQSYLFAPRLPESYAIWMGKLPILDEIKARYGVDQVHYSDMIKDVLSAFNPCILHTMFGKNYDSNKFSEEAKFEGIELFETNNEILHPVITECRVFKTPEEIQVLRYVNKISSEAHKEVMKKIRPGMYEYQLESIFHNYVYFNGGCRHVSYTCICASGPNGAALHYGHAGAPNNRKIRKDDMCLFDMGAEYNCYASDITCSFPASGVFTDDQKIIYNAVLKTSRAVLKAIKPGVRWDSMHMLAEKEILTRLIKAGLLQGDVQSMLNSRLGAFFMPHGLGHFMGIDTHDVGGYTEDWQRSPERGLQSLRTRRELEKGMVITVEPGIYFIESLLEEAKNTRYLRDYFVWTEIDRFRNFGGVRIEDNIVVEDDGIELLTKVPRTVEEIEALMAEGRQKKVELPQQNPTLNRSCYEKN